MIPNDLGRYKLQKELGRGPSAAVFKAIDTNSNRLTALKIFSDELQSQGELLKYLQQAVMLTSGIKHIHTAKVYAFESDRSSGYQFIASEYIDGGSLFSLLAANPRLDFPYVCLIAKAIASALDYAHSQRLVHGCLHPGNVVVERPTGRVVVNDFVTSSLLAARSLNGSADPQRLSFRAPEWNGEKIDAAADIFALGALMYYMLTGQFPAPGLTSTPGSSLPRMPELSSLLPLVPVWLESLVAGCMTADPRKRFSSAREIIGILDSNSSFDGREQPCLQDLSWDNIPAPAKTFVNVTSQAATGASPAGNQPSADSAPLPSPANSSSSPQAAAASASAGSPSPAKSFSQSAPPSGSPVPYDESLMNSDEKTLKIHSRTVRLRQSAEIQPVTLKPGSAQAPAPLSCPTNLIHADDTVKVRREQLSRAANGATSHKGVKTAAYLLIPALGLAGVLLFALSDRNTDRADDSVSNSPTPAVSAVRDDGRADSGRAVSSADEDSAYFRGTTLTITSQPNAEVMLDGELIGNCDELGRYVLTPKELTPGARISVKAAQSQDIPLETTFVIE